jgi:hypothetical protein
MIIVSKTGEYKLSIVPPQADSCTPCCLLNNFDVSLLPFDVLTTYDLEIFKY